MPAMRCHMHYYTSTKPACYSIYDMYACIYIVCVCVLLILTWQLALRHLPYPRPHHCWLLQQAPVGLALHEVSVR